VKTLHLEIMDKNDQRVELDRLTRRERVAVRLLCQDMVEALNDLEAQALASERVARRREAN